MISRYAIFQDSNIELDFDSLSDDDRVEAFDDDTETGHGASAFFKSMKEYENPAPKTTNGDSNRTGKDSTIKQPPSEVLKHHK